MVVSCGMSRQSVREALALKQRMQLNNIEAHDREKTSSRGTCAETEDATIDRNKLVIQVQSSRGTCAETEDATEIRNIDDQLHSVREALALEQRMQQGISHCHEGIQGCSRGTCTGTEDATYYLS